MITADLRMTETDWITLRKHLAGSFRSPQAPEAGAIGVVGECRAGDRHEFTVARMLWPGPDDLKVTENRALVFDARYIRRAHLLMRSEGLAGLVMFHSHPMSDQRVGFSLYDDHQEPQLFANLREMAPDTQLVSVVAGKRTQGGRVWTGRESPQALGRLVTVGETLGFHTLSGGPELPPPPPAAIFDRALALSGLLEVAGIAVWGTHLWRIMNRGESSIGSHEIQGLITADETVASVLERFPQTLPVLIEKGFTLLGNPLLRRTLARTISLRTAARMKELDPGSLVAALNRITAVHPGPRDSQSQPSPAETVAPVD